MVGFISEYMPQTGALGLSVIGGLGMMGVGMWQPVIGRWLDAEKASLSGTDMTEAAMNLAAGQATLGKILYFPLILIVAFALLYVLRGKFTKAAAND